MQPILVTGGAGFIGSHMVKMLAKSGYFPVILDNLSTGYEKSITTGKLFIADIADSSIISIICNQYNIKSAMHFAGSIDVAESMSNPDKYLENNTVKSEILINNLIANGVENFIFSSTAAIYGEPLYSPINEIHPANPVNIYGKSKLSTEILLQNSPINSVILRYFNAAGCSPDGEIGENHQPETHLLPLLVRAALGKEIFYLYGDDYPTKDGSAIRDLVHVDDICAAHILALSYLEQQNGKYTFNLGSNIGYSVMEVLNKVEELSAQKIKLNISPRRSGDPAILVSDYSNAKNILGWKPKYSLEDMINHVINYHLLYQFS